MSNQHIFDLHSAGIPPGIGNKAQKLRFLIAQGFHTPQTYVCTWDAYLRYQRDDHHIVARLKSELSSKFDLGQSYAIRSSANIEDSFDLSFAGQFKTVLNVQGADDILHAMWSIWATAHSSTVQAYLTQHAIDPQQLKMAILIQEMVSPLVSGVSFSKNPMTGLDEIIVEAVRGSGEALVQEGITPDRWINKWGAWLSKPAGSDIALDLIQEVVRQTKAIAKAYGHAVDLEWVYDGRTIHWVQLREITSIDIDLYSNHISKEVFPGMIKPLVWSVNVPLVNGAWVRLFTELIGPNDIHPNDLAKSFYYRAYFNMGAIGRIFEMLGLPRETLELLMGIDFGGPDRPSFKPARSYTLLPRLVRVAADKLRFKRRIETFLPSAREQYQLIHTDHIHQLSAQELLAKIDRLYALTQEVAYYNIVTPLLMQIYNRVLQGQLSRVGVDFERLDLTSGLEELQQFEPHAHLSELHRAYQALNDDQLRSRIGESSYQEFLQLSGITALQEQVQRFLAQFGHLSDSGNDFSSTPWREDPDLILKMMANYSPPDDKPAHQVRFEDLRLSPPRRLLLRPLYRRARQFRLHREAVSSTYTFGYGLFRNYFLALGDHLARRGTIQAGEDILYLYFDQVRSLVQNDAAQGDHREQISRIKREMEACRNIIPPSIIFGDHTPPVETPAADKLIGTPTSRGNYTGPARVVHGLRDFDKLQPGDVLVIPFSDVGWTPLFTKAGAVIAESGGILSHSSIVAREYNIPAVVSVPGACQLADDTIVTVDGYRGEIVIHASREG
jgi:phosphohistidine swiveling domain-containing protein